MDKELLLLLSSFEGISASGREKILKNYKNLQDFLYALKNREQDVYQYIREEFLPVVNIRLCEDELLKLQRQMRASGIEYQARGEGILYYKGDIALLEQDCVTVLGSRNCSSQGTSAAEKVAKALSQSGVSVMSVLSFGINEAALKSAKYAIGVVCGGLLGRHDKLPLLVSEFPLSMPPLKHMYNLCNHFMVSRSKALVIIEAGEGSNTLLAADLANQKGVQVFCLPSAITNAYGVGSNQYLFQRPESLAISENMILEFLGKECGGEKKERRAAIGKEQRLILDAILRNQNSYEQIQNAVQLNALELNQTLMMMELDGMIAKLAGNKYKVV